ncbi:MAG: hypothetical protein JXB39_01940 [Deltaproteobacteria bacterium]|nr:hypothetical protein [Deltaproteobacteria bacterium]
MNLAAGLLARVLAAGLVGCAPPALDLVAIAGDGGVEVVATRSLDRVTVHSEDGALVALRTMDPPTAHVFVPIALPPGSSGRVQGRTGSIASVASWHNPAAPGPVRLAIEVPLGQPQRPVRAGEVLDVPVPQGSRVPLALHLEALCPVEARVRVDGRTEDLGPIPPGAQRTVLGTLGSEDPVAVEVGISGTEAATFALRPRSLSATEAAGHLEIEDVRFPADAWGRAWRARRSDRVDLPSPWWHALLARAGLGIRARPDQAPWAWQAVTLTNTARTDLPVVLEAVVLDPSGTPAPAFRPRLREAEGGTGTVAALLSVPAGGSATAALPLFVDDDLLPAEASSWTRRIAVLPLGGDEALLVEERPLHARRGNTWATLGLLHALGSALVGLALLMARTGGWLRAARTSDLVTLALFGTLGFVASVASQLLGMAVGAILGPFSPLLTGLVDDVFRVALLATLVTLLPRPGTIALAVLLAFLMRGLAMGSFHPLDLVALGTSVAWLEGTLFLVGATRSPGWHDRSRWGRRIGLAVAFSVAGMASTLGNLAMSAVFYRLWYASWYVFALLALPSGIYMVLACWLAVPFADSLRRVEA